MESWTRGWNDPPKSTLLVSVVVISTVWCKLLVVGRVVVGWFLVPRETKGHPMTDDASLALNAPTYLVNRSTKTGAYTIWRLDPDAPELFRQVATDKVVTLAPDKKLCAVGGYLLEYDLDPLQDDPAVAPYRLFEFDPDHPDPLNAKPLQKGKWPKSKFWQFFDHYTWDPTLTDIVELVPMTGYVMVFMPTAARGTYMLWNFDPAPDAPGTADPLPNALTPQDAFSLIGEGSQLLPVGNYVLEWIAATSTWRVWNFDPQRLHPLELPVTAEGSRPDIDSSHRLIVLGEHILAWVPTTRAFRLWRFDPHRSDPFVGPVANGTLPANFTSDSDLVAVQTRVPVDTSCAATPGTMDFMRDRIEHVVVYMLESRTMDSVLGWLYEHDAPAHFVDAAPPFRGTSLDLYNEADGKKYNVYQFKDGKLSEDFVLAAPAIDPFHATSDSIMQQWSGGYADYDAGKAPDMGGYVTNNVSGEPMVTFSPTQLPVLNGLARAFAVSDDWFSPMPGGTIANRAFALSGSNYNITVNCEGQPQYDYFAEVPRRQPIWKVLQNNGITDWKIYYAVLWYDAVFTYHLYLRNQLPSVDKNKERYVSYLENFFADAAAGMLPKFSFLEPAWIAPSGATSYHPGATGNMVPGEIKLNEIYQALADGPKWDRTAFVITFSKGGGLYDHVPPGPATRGWPRDVNDGFSYDVLGPRVPTIVVSPLVEEGAVFRSPEDRPFSATSLLSTVLEWQGIPRSRWGLGDRVQDSPVFANVFTRDTPRTDKPAFTPPYDKTYPPGTSG